MSTVTLFKLLLVGLLFFIIINLGKALFQMLRSSSQENKKPMSHYLGKRVMLSAIVVILLLIALGSGFISPNPKPY